MSGIFFLAFIAMVLMCAAPLALAAGLRRLFRVPWWLFLFGCATFFASQVVHLPLNEWLADVGWLSAPEGPQLPIWRDALVLGLSAGLCEELARALGFLMLPRKRQLEDSLMMGLGHGGFEAMTFGGIVTLGTVAALMPFAGQDLSTLDLSPEQMHAITLQLQVFTYPWSVFVTLVERLLAIGMQTVLSLMVWQTFREKRRWWGLPLAIGYHALVDTGAVLIRGVNQNIWVLEGAFLLILLPGLFWAWHQRPLVRLQRPLQSLKEEWRLFLAALTKELRYAWRSNRVVVVFGVYALFGLTSPLLAYFTPQIIASIPEAQVFSELIPTPTAADAMLQYVKNVTQFGFVLAVLLGMGAIAGEKENGTAVMVLSKPLPRWAFVLSKFSAQALVYLGAYLFTAVGAAYYTWYLFGELHVGNFAVVNGLLYIWLLPYVGLALLGSALGKTSGVAAGIGLGGALVLLGAGAIPRYGLLAPGALVNWAQILGTGGDPLQAAATGGMALGVALVVTILAVLGAVAAFEVEEI